MPLNARQKAFAEQYVIDFNGAQAAIRAGYTKKTARITASKLLTNFNVKRHVEDLQEKIAERNGITADVVIEQLRSLASWNIQDFIGEGNVVKDLSKMDRRTLRPVTGIKTITRYEIDPKGLPIKITTTEVKFADKRATWVDLGKHAGIFKEDNNQKNLVIRVHRK